MKYLCIIRRPAQYRPRAISMLVLALILSWLGNTPASAEQAACLYGYEWLHIFRFPRSQTRTRPTRTSCRAFPMTGRLLASSSTLIFHIRHGSPGPSTGKMDRPRRS